MKVFKIRDMQGGWFIGDFKPSVYKTKAFEVCYKTHTKGEHWERHYHASATEINYLIRGKMVIQGKQLSAGDIFVLKPKETADPEFLEDCELIVVKIPSVRADKYKV